MELLTQQFIYTITSQGDRLFISLCPKAITIIMRGNSYAYMQLFFSFLLTYIFVSLKIITMYKYLKNIWGWFVSSSSESNDKNIDTNFIMDTTYDIEFDEAYWSDDIEEEWKVFMETEDFVSCSTVFDNDWEYSYEVVDNGCS